jgi:hypothetical protein
MSMSLVAAVPPDAVTARRLPDRVALRFCSHPLPGPLAQDLAQVLPRPLPTAVAASFDLPFASNVNIVSDAAAQVPQPRIHGCSLIGSGLPNAQMPFYLAR